jgi:hypothetical protein
VREVNAPWYFRREESRFVPVIGDTEYVGKECRLRLVLKGLAKLSYVEPIPNTPKGRGCG